MIWVPVRARRSQPRQPGQSPDIMIPLPSSFMSRLWDVYEAVSRKACKVCFRAPQTEPSEKAATPRPEPGAVVLPASPSPKLNAQAQLSPAAERCTIRRCYLNASDDLAFEALVVFKPCSCIESVSVCVCFASTYCSKFVPRPEADIARNTGWLSLLLCASEASF